MATTIPNISQLPPPPQSNDPTNFDQRADPFVQGLQVMSTELGAAIPKMNTLGAEVENNAAAASSAASTAVNAPGSASTSSTSHSLSLGAKTFTVQTGKAWTAGQIVNIVRTSNPAGERMQGVVTSYNSGSGALAVEIVPNTIIGGSSTAYTNWAITLAGGAVQPQVIIDRAYSEVGYGVFSPLINAFNRAPTNTEGSQILAATITPKTTTNRLRVRVVCPVAASSTDAGGQNAITLALFVNGTFRQSASIWINTGWIAPGVLEFEFVPGVVSAQAITIRAGCFRDSLILCGNQATGAFFGGTMKGTLIVEELVA